MHGLTMSDQEPQHAEKETRKGNGKLEEDRKA